MNLIQLLAMTIYLEAADQPYEGKIAVAKVIMERVSDDRWPDTIRSVIMQPKQFSCWNRRRPDDFAFKDNKAGRECLEIAEACLDAKLEGAGYNHYHSYNIKPEWAKGKKGNRIGDHIFYKL